MSIAHARPSLNQASIGTRGITRNQPIALNNRLCPIGNADNKPHTPEARGKLLRNLGVMINVPNRPSLRFILLWHPRVTFISSGRPQHIVHPITVASNIVKALAKCGPQSETR
jgi:hypothetical protein